jgi:hypothetical protein
MSLPKHFPANRNSLLSRIIRAVFDRGLRGWTLRILIGPGAGYGRWIFNRKLFIPTGWTLWIGRNVYGGRGDLYRTRPWSIGFTKAAPAVPHTAH